MDTKNVTLFVFDEQENFEKSKNSIATEGVTIKKIIWIDNLKSFEENLNTIDDEDYISLVVHVFGTSEDLKGIKKFITSQIESRYPKLKPMYITDKLVDKSKIDHLCVDLDINPIAHIHKYHHVLSNIGNDVNVYTKKDIINTPEIPKLISEDFQIDYAVITALYENEFEEIEKLFDFEKSIAETETLIYKIGKLKNTEKRVVACFATKTGMVEAAIIATEMINKFKPKYIFMPGVCGGSDDTKFGSVIIAEKVFIFQKGKLSDLKEETEEGKQKTKLYYDKSEFDRNKVVDSKGDQINLIIEKFESESEVIDIDSKLKQLIVSKLKGIENKINEPYAEDEKITVGLESMACSMMVINKEDYFDQNILPHDRKTKAVEMESYGVARAAKIANGGRTKFLIFKSIMDKTNFKNDSYKKKAAYTSAQFLRHLLEIDII